MTVQQATALSNNFSEPVQQVTVKPLKL